MTTDMTTRFAQARAQVAAVGIEMRKLVEATTQANENLGVVARQLEDARWHNTLRGERVKARRWWGEHITAAYARYGWDWPGPAAPLPVVVGRVVCDAEAADCRCVKDAGHEDLGDRVHGCDPEVCTGQWTGSYDPVRWDGGSFWEPITMPKKVPAKAVTQ